MGLGPSCRGSVPIRERQVSPLGQASMRGHSGTAWAMCWGEGPHQELTRPAP